MIQYPKSSSRPHNGVLVFYEGFDVEENEDIYDPLIKRGVAIAVNKAGLGMINIVIPFALKIVDLNAIFKTVTFNGTL